MGTKMSSQSGKITDSSNRYRVPVTDSRFWWLKNRRYLSFMLRELSVLFVAIFLIVYLVQFAFLASGEDNYNQFLNFMKNPLWIAANIIFFAFAVLHSITWFNLVPVVTPIKLKGKEIPRLILWGMGLIFWVGVSIIIAIIVMAFS